MYYVPVKIEDIPDKRKNDLIPRWTFPFIADAFMKSDYEAVEVFGLHRNTARQYIFQHPEIGSKIKVIERGGRFFLVKIRKETE